MQGTVTHIKDYGVLISVDRAPEIGDLFEIYRIQDGVEVILASGYMRKKKEEWYKINPIDNEDGSRGAQFVGVEVGDLARKIS